MSASEEKGIMGSEEAGARGLVLALEGGGAGRAGALQMQVPYLCVVRKHMI